ncbi:MAG: hypothetical protein OSB65_18195 [Roseibacillus sp.]|nr:hypothetical protein [Roseibacillus sp.]
MDVEGLSFAFGVLSVLDASDDSVLKVLEEEVDAVTADWEQVTKALPPRRSVKRSKSSFGSSPMTSKTPTSRDGMWTTST